MREDALRPSSYLGYDHDTLGIYFLEREAFALAEAQFRRAAWLNPYELMFPIHQAQALLRLGLPDRARLLLHQVLVAHPDNDAARRLWRRHWPDEPMCP